MTENEKFAANDHRPVSRISLSDAVFLFAVWAFTATKFALLVAFIFQL